ncbi:transglutaminase family protein [Nocardioides sp. SYSU D00038]|uniref:transglutaminase family protein n=1 Tax=Nocardioides sp. SYSU D00038 TaxID=2812554 RepID=UPI0019675F36|nr:transglutaminase family protein [Nocardioides sp. SYSU D00038]
MRYRVAHTTTYGYDAPVADSVGVGHLRPRALPWQHVESTEVRVTPEPLDLGHDSDYYGNAVTYFQVVEPHTELVVEATSVVDVHPPAYDDAGLARPWERARPLAEPHAPGAWAVTDFALASALVDHEATARDYAAASLAPGRPLGEAVLDLVARVNRDFDYDATATTVTSTVADTLARRAGVCQDFAHLTLACLRSHGVAARYVSGYLATEPAPGRSRVVGADASHAWVAVWVPGSETWLMVDPTNDQVVADRHVTVAWGRDYADVPPVKGVIFTEAATSTLRVSVDVSPLDREEPCP